MVIFNVGPDGEQSIWLFKVIDEGLFFFVFNFHHEQVMQVWRKRRKVKSDEYTRIGLSVM